MIWVKSSELAKIAWNCLEKSQWLGPQLLSSLSLSALLCSPLSLSLSLSPSVPLALSLSLSLSALPLLCICSLYALSMLSLCSLYALSMLFLSLSLSVYAVSMLSLSLLWSLLSQNARKHCIQALWCLQPLRPPFWKTCFWAKFLRYMLEKCPSILCRYFVGPKRSAIHLWVR